MTVFQLKSFLPLTDGRDHSDDDDDDDDDTKHQQSLKIISRTFQQITGRGFFSREKNILCDVSLPPTDYFDQWSSRP